MEAAVGWKLAVERHNGPTALILSRQNLAQVERTPDQVKEIARGGYVLKDSGGKPDIILIATGSEMEITLQAAEKLAGEGRNVRVVSCPRPIFSMPRMRNIASRYCLQMFLPAWQ